MYAVAEETCCNNGELDLTGIDDDELDQVCYSQQTTFMYGPPYVMNRAQVNS